MHACSTMSQLRFVPSLWIATLRIKPRLDFGYGMRRVSG